MLPLWRHSSSRLIAQIASSIGDDAPDQQLVERREHRRDDRRQRRIAEEQRDDQPGQQASPAPSQGLSASSTPAAVATPLPPLKRKNTGHRWPTNAASPTKATVDVAQAEARPEATAPATPAHSPSSASSSQRQQRRRAVARAQHVGGAGVARAVAARVGQAHAAADDDRKRQRTDQIGHDNSDKAGQCRTHGGRCAGALGRECKRARAQGLPDAGCARLSQRGRDAPVAQVPARRSWAVR